VFETSVATVTITVTYEGVVVETFAMKLVVDEYEYEALRAPWAIVIVISRSIAAIAVVRHFDWGRREV
jgi:hypothetical protein